MKPRFTFQTIILVVLAPVVAVLTGLWTWQVYHSAHRVILAGFDRKLLTAAGGAAAFVDGDAHARYQRSHTVIALASSPAGLIGFDSNQGVFVTIDPASGAAIPLAGAPAASAPKCLATSPKGDAAFIALSDDGRTILPIRVSGGPALPVVPLSSPLDGIFLREGQISGWRDKSLFNIDLTTGSLTKLSFDLPEPTKSLVSATDNNRWFGLSMDGTALLVMDAQAKPVRRVTLNTVAAPADGATEAAAQPQPEPAGPLQALAFRDNRLWGAGVSLVTVDPEKGCVASGERPPGYFDTGDAFYRRYREAFIELQKTAGLSYLYTQVYDGGTRIHYILDGTVTPGYALPGTEDELPANTVEAAERVQLAGRPWISPIQSWETWGLLKSCFTPIRGSDNRVVAMAGADVDIGIIRGKTRWAAFAAILIGVASMIAAGWVSFRVARALTRPLQKLKESTLWIAAGYYDDAISVGGTREISTFAGALDGLRTRLDEEGRRVRSWQQEIREARQRTALSQALEETMAHVGGTSLARGGICHRASDVVRWHTVAVDDKLAADCARARNATLAFELMASGRPQAGLADSLLAADSDILAVAHWHEGTNTLHYCTRSPFILRTASTDHTVSGSGRLRFAVCPSIEWLPAPESHKTAEVSPCP